MQKTVKRNSSKMTPSNSKTVFNPHRSASAPASGNSTIMTMEKHMLSTEIKVALCSDGISAFRESDWIGYTAAFANPAHIRAAIATPAFPAP